ncbi:MAG TPA: Hpt domain-containing protein [Pseudolabrys sp.]|jgi:HPt (histidine-containing phosphotransfer) domain-containing protein|nr:Hpt domain-containing protein [Pseudolabrys sp.]
MRHIASNAIEISVPDGAVGQPIDRAHLTRMTLGDRSLEREVLQLFERQAEMLLERMNEVEAASVPALAHTLKGSARGIGAWNVARAAEALELADGAPAEFEAAKRELASTVATARAIITELLRAH